MFILIGIILTAIAVIITSLAIIDEYKWSRESGREPFRESSGKWQPGAKSFLSVLVVVLLIVFWIVLRRS
jgi:predicted RND superfamily exporter protein